MADENERKLAKLHLNLAHALFARREALELRVEELAASLGMPSERLIAIEEGDTSSVTEIVQLCHALNAELRVDNDFGVHLVPVAGFYIQWVRKPVPFGRTTFGSAASHIQSAKPFGGAFERPTTCAEPSPVHARQ